MSGYTDRKLSNRYGENSNYGLFVSKPDKKRMPKKIVFSVVIMTPVLIYFFLNMYPQSKELSDTQVEDITQITVSKEMVKPLFVEPIDNTGLDSINKREKVKVFRRKTARHIQIPDEKQVYIPKVEVLQAKSKPKALPVKQIENRVRNIKKRTLVVNQNDNKPRSNTAKIVSGRKKDLYSMGQYDARNGYSPNPKYYNNIAYQKGYGDA